MDGTTIKTLLARMDGEFLKNYVPPKNRSELTAEDDLLEEINFFSAEAFKLGLRLGAEVFSENRK